MRTLGLAMLILAGVATIRADDAPAAGRVIQGVARGPEGRVVAGGLVMAESDDPQRRVPFTDEMSSRLDEHGRFRLDLARFDWSAGPVRLLVLAEGFKPAFVHLDAGSDVAEREIKLEPGRWWTGEIRLLDPDGAPAAGIEVVCRVNDATWSRTTADAEGRCCVSMAAGAHSELEVKAPGYRPLMFSVFAGDGPEALTIRLRRPIEGQVIGPDRRPAAGIKIFRRLMWNARGTPMFQEWTTDAEGRFRIALPVRGSTYQLPDASGRLRESPLPLGFTDEKLGSMAFLIDDPSQTPGPLKVILKPTRMIELPLIRASDQARQAGWYIGLDDANDANRSLMVRFLAKLEDRVRVALPPGRFRLCAWATGADGRIREEKVLEMIVPEHDGPRVAPEIRLEPVAYVKMLGQPAPEIDAVDLDSGEPVRLADFRGKVVILDFWGTWCGPCVIRMPKLAELQEKYRDRGLVVLSIHDASVRTRAEYDRRIAPTRDRLWGGRNLPLRVLLDRPDPEKDRDRDDTGTGATIRTYDVRGFPTYFVIDARGRFVGLVSSFDTRATEETIQRLLDEADSNR